MFSDRVQYNKANKSQQKLGSHDELDVITQLSSKSFLKTISSPQILSRKNQKTHQNKSNIKLEPINSHQKKKNVTQETQQSQNDLQDSYYFAKQTNKSQQGIKIEQKSSYLIDSSKIQIPKEQDDSSQHDLDQNNSSIQLKKSHLNLLPYKNSRYTEQSVKDNNKHQISEFQKINDDSLLENNSFSKLFETNKRISLQNQKREDALNELISQIQVFLTQQPGQSQKDASVVSNALSNLMNTIDNAQKNEMELNQAMREMHKYLKTNLKLQNERENFKNQTKLGAEELLIYKQKYEGANADIRLLKKDNLQLQQKNEELRKKNQTYEKRLELLSDYNPAERRTTTLESNMNEESLISPVDNNQSFHTNKKEKTSTEEIKSSSKIQTMTSTNQTKPPQLYKNGQMQIVLADLVKENENFKKQIKLKDKEIERLKELNYKQLDKMNRLYKKIDLIKMKRVAKEEENKNSINDQDEDKFNFEKNELPMTVDFKVQSLPLRQQNFLSDLQEHGKESFLSQFDDDKKDQIELIISQLSQYREFCEKINAMIHETLYLLNFTSIDDILVYISRNFKQNFQAENVHLWIKEAETGILRTFNQQGKELRALTTKGMFYKCLDQQKIINFKFNQYMQFIDSSLKEVSVYQDTDGNTVFQDRCVVFPIYLSLSNSQQQQLVGIFEVSKLFSERMEVDEQFQAIYLTKILRFIFKKIHENNVLSYQLRTADINQEFFQELCTSKSKFQFCQIIKKWASIILQSSSSQFVFVEDDQIILHQNSSETKQASSKISLASLIIKEKKSMIFYDSKKQVEFQQDLDISSLLPIYYSPVIIEDVQKNIQSTDKYDETSKKRVVGVLQFVIKQKKKVTSQPVSQLVISDKGLLSQDIEYRNFCQYVQSAYQLLYSNNQ